MKRLVQTVKPIHYEAISLKDITDWQKRLGALIEFCKTKHHTICYLYSDDHSIAFHLNGNRYTLDFDEWLLFNPLENHYFIVTEAEFSANFARGYSK